MTLPRALAELQMEVEAVATRYGLDTFPVIFEMVDYAQMNQLAAYTGFPVRYPHWRWGMEFEQLDKSYEYGLHKIYEMVINNDPTYAYLLEGNSFLDHKLVMAHVYGHADFFKHNVFFSNTNRQMIDAMANHATRVRRYRDQHGIDKIERFLDDCLAIEDLIDPNAAFEQQYGLGRIEEEDTDPIVVKRLKAKDYMDSFINPPDYIERRRAELERQRQQQRGFPARPQRDILGFLLKHAPLENWEQDVLDIIRKESYYFLPQRKTKIMNEGWASYWHTTILTRDLLDDSEIIDFADHHSGTTAVQPGRLNPYKLGLELFRDIEFRWNTGRFGAEWRDCDDMAERANWMRDTGLGREKIFEVRRVHSDLSFIDEFLTPEFCHQHKLFTFARDPRREAWVLASRQFEEIKRTLLFQLTNAGTPIIEVVDGNYRNRAELLLVHHHEGVELRLDWAQEALAAICRIWRRPVYLETIVGRKPRRLGYDGSQHSEEEIKAVASAKEQ
ncbi:MAG TPA: SpoVR family protein [Acidobacteria bacterium]|nr:SpoVR family protein [Acidobacteriota bacterium]